MGIANLAKFDDFRLEEKEADTLAAATSELMATFDFTPDPRFQAVAGFVSVSAMIYGPRAYLYRRHLEKKKGERKEAQTNASNIVSFASPETSPIVDGNDWTKGIGKT